MSYNKIMKFLHISDIHLGCDLYHIEGEERMKDYGRAWAEVLHKYGVGEKVDFVLIGGDLFDKKTPAPRAMIHAINGLTMLKEAGIPAIAIEGNHDNVSSGKEFSWLHTLCEMGLVKLLESNISADENGNLTSNMRYWNDEDKKGEFIDIGNARIFGTSWHGASIEKIVPSLVDSISKNRREGAFHILMLHSEIEGENISPFPLLTMNTLKLLQPVTDYVALGHIHKHYVIDNWAFNPGSLEVTSVGEIKDQRGALLVEFDEENRLSHKLIEDYYRRPFDRIKFDVSGKIPEQVYDGIFAKVEREVEYWNGKDVTKKPIIELTLQGTLGFNTAELEISKIRVDLQNVTKALHILIKNQTVPRDLPVGLGMETETDRRVLEKNVLADLVSRDNRFKYFSEEIADVVVEVKNKTLLDDAPEEIAQFIEEKIVSRSEVAAV
jgi:DNA repair protein SbcD/Mre11